MIFLLLALQTAPVFAKPFIVNGVKVQANDPLARSIAALIIHDVKGNEYICTGSIMDSSHILTAGHCVDKFHSGDVVFKRDHVFEAKSPQFVKPISGAQILPGYPTRGQSFEGFSSVYDRNEYTDMAIVTFSGGLPPGFEAARFLNINHYFQATLPGNPLVLIGYGITSGKADDAGVLRRTTSQIESFSKHGLNLSTTSSKGQTCDGDSGGPAIMYIDGISYVVGVLSRSDCESVSIYTTFYTVGR